MGVALVVAAILASAGAGVAARERLGARAEPLVDRLLKAALYTVLPIVVFFNVVGLRLTGDVVGGLALAWVALLAGGTVAFLVGRRRWAPERTGAVVVAVLAANTGYLGYPLTTIFLGGDELSRAVAYDVLVAVPILVVVCFAVGATLGEEAGEGARQRARSFALRNPLLPAFALALVAPDGLAPQALVELSQALVFAVLPLGFFAVGVYLAATSSRRLLPRPGPEIALAVGLRVLLVPVLLAGLAAPLIELPDVYLLLAAMPAGLNTLVVASTFGLDRGVAAGAIAWSTLLVLAVALPVALAGVP